MTDPISASGAKPPSETLSMFDMPNPVDRAGFVSDLGDRALAKVEAMQETFQSHAAEMDASPSDSAHFQVDTGEKVTASENTMMRAVEGLEHSMKMQADLAQFVMLSSVTSAFGKNLNSFLRGQ